MQSFDQAWQLPLAVSNVDDFHAAPSNSIEYAKHLDGGGTQMREISSEPHTQFKKPAQKEEPLRNCRVDRFVDCPQIQASLRRKK
jgi:hypothetical protein